MARRKISQRKGNALDRLRVSSVRDVGETCVLMCSVRIVMGHLTVKYAAKLLLVEFV